ncbi:hypothetical protein M378DRAFT_168408 [Amanita muscaria Koide BX008]|uniref:Uncharacterized protein n=1 Tax=Amanita muscaria (strain Koide BX008) TaxID=946122 RepID=A0A0C2WLY2_AMAMK|nr:hypothetical protein M378DRAFT_171389 [Amanita muscaria Koide BX008]KIL60131.1 hypothetical protein M378DRAFT_168408 [Amanita muscaria Koide BX008]
MDARRFSFVVDVSTIDAVTKAVCVDTCRPKHCPEIQNPRVSKRARGKRGQCRGGLVAFEYTTEGGTVAKDYEKTKEELRRHGEPGKDVTF